MSASAATPQAVQKVLPKVLRIGIVQDGKIAQERLIRHGEVVTVGESPRNTFVVTGTKLGARHDLFVFVGGSYSLSVPEWVEGKIQWKDGIRGLDELRTRTEMQKKGESWHLPLGENIRGKVSLGNTTVLFQFVPAPPEPVRPVTAADFRSHILDEDDPLFLGLLGVFTVVAAAFMLYVYITPVVERVDLDAIDEAASLVVEKKIEKIELVDPNAVPDQPAEKPAEKPVEKAEKPAPKPAEEAAPTADSVKKKSIFLQMIGTNGDASGAADDILGDDNAAMAGLDSALNGVSGVQEANANNVGLMNGGKGGRGDAAVGIDKSGAGGTSETGGGAAVKIKKPNVGFGDMDTEADPADSTGIGTVVKKSRGLIESCLEQSLKLNADVNGRVSVGWTIQSGKVTEAHLVTNTTGDDALGQCITKKVRSFRFDPGLSTSVNSYAWAVSGQ